MWKGFQIWIRETTYKCTQLSFGQMMMVQLWDSLLFQVVLFSHLNWMGPIKDKFNMNQNTWRITHNVIREMLQHNREQIDAEYHNLFQSRISLFLWFKYTIIFLLEFFLWAVILFYITWYCTISYNTISYYITLYILYYIILFILYIFTQESCWGTDILSHIFQL